MKTCIHFSLVILLLVSVHCSTENNCENIHDPYSNTQLYKVDSIYRNVNIEHTNCTIKIVRTKFDENGKKYEEVNQEEWWLDESPKTILIYDNSNCKMLFHKKLEGFKINLVKQDGFSKNGTLLMHLISSGGGSGFTAWTHQFVFANKKLQTKEIMQSNELSTILMHKNTSDIFIIQGIWNMSGWNEKGEGESHFSAHKQKIFCYKAYNQCYRKEYLGTTRNLYDLKAKTAIQLLKEIVRHEKGIIPANVNPMEFNSFNNWEGTFDK